uniref:Uncharacterized protein n=1 Tax=Cacopsylla melanoneura TaxID=428564 RepID=A0A8D8SDX6_9HEMI
MSSALVSSIWLPTKRISTSSHSTAPWLCGCKTVPDTRNGRQQRTKSKSYSTLFGRAANGNETNSSYFRPKPNRTRRLRLRRRRHNHRWEAGRLHLGRRR